MELLSNEKLVLFSIFVIPGFISTKMWSLLNPTKEMKIKDYIFEIVVYSFLNFAILFYFVSNIASSQTSKNLDTIVIVLDWFLVFLLGPITWPSVLHFILTRQFVSKYLLHPSPSAWDYLFGLRKTMFVLIHLKGEKLIGGLYSGQSFFSAFPNKKDIYVSQVWKLKRDGRFIEPMADSEGLYVSYDSIEYVEFFSAKEQED